MRRLLVSIIIAFSLISIYATILCAIFVLSKKNFSLIFQLNLPLRIPVFLLDYFFAIRINQNDLSNPTKIVGIFSMSFISNVIIYSIPVYLVLGLFKKKKSADLLNQPPPPPTF